jgi:hypothetical protein
MGRSLFDVPVSSGPGSYTGRIPKIYPNRKAASIVVNTRRIGLPEWFTAAKNWSKSMDLAAGRAITKAVKFLLKETLKVTPLDTGRLKSSGLYAVSSSLHNVVGIVYFDSKICPYAIYVHEDLTKYHKPPTIAKFLQRTQWEKRGEINRIIREELSKAHP